MWFLIDKVDIFIAWGLLTSQSFLSWHLTTYHEPGDKYMHDTCTSKTSLGHVVEYLSLGVDKFNILRFFLGIFISWTTAAIVSSCICCCSFLHMMLPYLTSIRNFQCVRSQSSAKDQKNIEGVFFFRVSLDYLLVTVINFLVYLAWILQFTLSSTYRRIDGCPLLLSYSTM